MVFNNHKGIHACSSLTERVYPIAGGVRFVECSTSPSHTKVWQPADGSGAVGRNIEVSHFHFKVPLPVGSTSFSETNVHIRMQAARDTNKEKNKQIYIASSLN